MTESAIIMVNCQNKSSKNIINIAKKIKGVKHAYRVDRKKFSDADIIVSMRNITESEIFNARNELNKIEGLTNLRISIGKSQKSI